MRRSAEYNGEPIAMRLPQEILFRNSAVLPQPVGDRQLRKACPQNLTGLLPNDFQILAQQYGWNSPIWVRHEHQVKLRMNSGSEAKKRNEGVIKRCEVTPQVNQSVFSRRHFLQQLLLGQISKEFARAINVRPPIPK